MPKTQLITLPAKGATPLAVVAPIMCTRVEIVEDDAATAVGIVLYKQDDNFVQPYTIAPAREPVALGNPVPMGAGRGKVLGHPVQSVAGTGGPMVLRAADIVFKATSASASTTNVRVSFYE